MDNTEIKENNEKELFGKGKTVGIISLGCDKNRVDSEVMISYLSADGYSFSDDADNCDIIIINTCGFISSARTESRETIEEMCELKKERGAVCKKIVVTGCMAQKWADNIKEDFPDVDIIIGVDDYDKIAEILKNSFEADEQFVKIGEANSLPYIKNRFVTTPAHYAYLKIADGCDNYCTFCTIPSIRGRYRSRPLDEILEEARDLVSGGATELILIAQDISRYGTENGGEPRLIELIRRLSEIEGLTWIRLLYCYPEMITDELLDEMMNNPKLCKYIDVPLQHISDSVLKRMNRKSNKQQIEEFVSKVKSLPEFVAVRTTLMTGFPGETEEDFALLCDFVKDSKLMNVGFFAYSREEGTPAYNMPDQIDEKVKKKRLQTLKRLQAKIMKEINKSLIGKVLDVCYEGIDFELGLFYGRCQYQAPDVDTLIFFTSKQHTEVGRHYKVKITSCLGSDLKGEVVNE